MFKRKLLAQLLAGAALVVGSTGMVQATVSDLLGTLNTIEDDSNEYVYRPDGAGGYTLITSGDLAVGDVLLQILDFPIVNNVNIDSAGYELTGVALNIVDSITPVGNIDPPGPRPAYAAIDVTFVPGTAAQWLSLAGINLGTLGFDTTNLFSLLYEDSTNNLNVGTQGLPTGLNNAKDGILRVGLSFADPVNDFVAASDSPASLDTFSPTFPGSVPGVSQFGGFDYNLSVAYQNFPGWNINSSFAGSGTNVTTNRPLVAAVIDDTQATFTAARIPEPGSVALLSAGLLGLGFSKRRRNKVAA